MKNIQGLNRNQQWIKRFFDLFFSLIGILVLALPMLILIIIATIATKKNGLFYQVRVGQEARLFTMYKIRTMIGGDEDISITLAGDNRITEFGKFLRRLKLDELPQLFNVLKNEMSLVGPRPDVPGYMDKLIGEDRIILTLKPGITGPATLKFRDEEELLARQEDPKKYNDEIIWRKKVKLNKQYIENWTLLYDIKCIVKTIF